MDAFPVVCTAATQNYGPCFTQTQARINCLDAAEISTGNLSVSGLLKTPSAQVQSLVVATVAAETLVGTPSIPTATLGQSLYSLAPDAVTLNGQELQPTLLETPGAVPLNLANGSVILMGVPINSVLSVTFVLSRLCNPGTFYHFFNASAVNCTLALSDAGTIDSSAGSASSYTVPPNQRGVIFKVGPSYWVVMAS
jgi:hypothetical protein